MPSGKASLSAPIASSAQLIGVRTHRERLELLNAAGLKNPYFESIDARGDAEVQIDGSPHHNFSSYNYLGLASHRQVLANAKAGVEQYGMSVSASRLASGERAVHRELESSLAKLHHTESALVFISGYLTNLTVIPCLVGRRDLILTDSFVHESISAGARLSGAVEVKFAHNDPEDLARKLEERRDQHRKAWIVVESVYSMDGDIGNLPPLIELARRFDAQIMVDEAHAVGVLGATGLGAREHFGLQANDVDLWMGTLSKTLGSSGGYIAGRADHLLEIRYDAGGMVFSAGLPAPNTIAAQTSLELMLAEPERVERLQERAAYFRSRARAKGLDTGLCENTAIVPIILRDSVRAITVAAQLQDRGVLVHPVIFPAVSSDQARLRFFLTSEHRVEQIDETIDLLTQILKT